VLVLWTVPALALEVGQCDTPEGLSAKIKAEGHKIVATMERVGNYGDRVGITVTVHFIDGFRHPESAALTYAWTFGDGASATGPR
jgi:hypothetical protein